jgi:hypothetical protein
VVIQLDVPLVDGMSGAIVMGSLVTMAEKHLDDYESCWKNRLDQVEAVDRFFEWAWKKRVLVSSGDSEGYAIEYEKMTQGLMMLRVRGKRSIFDENRRIVYVSRLSTAPWNRQDLQNPVRLRAVGGQLLQFARMRSHQLGYGGLVGLHSLPESEMFYNKMNMMDCDLDEEYDNLRYFEWYQPRPEMMDDLGL